MLEIQKISIVLWHVSLWLFYWDKYPMQLLEKLQVFVSSERMNKISWSFKVLKRGIIIILGDSKIQPWSVFLENSIEVVCHCFLLKPKSSVFSSDLPSKHKPGVEIATFYWVSKICRNCRILELEWTRVTGNQSINQSTKVLQCAEKAKHISRGNSPFLS